MRITFICCLLLLTFSIVCAQETTPEPTDGWAIEQRCVGEPTTPPDDWSFDGTILMTNPYRDQLHAYHQGWETPRILVFYSEGSEMAYSGQLSPDGRWFAVIDGYRQDIRMFVTWQSEAIHVYSTVNDEEYIIPWDNWFAAIHTLGGHGLYWVDNQHLLYSMGDSEDEDWFLINPFTGGISDWEAEFNPTWDHFILSPDGTKAIYWNGWGPDWTTLYNGENEIPITLSNSVWSPDSSQFIGYTLQGDLYTTDQLALFDLEGNITNVILNLSGRIPVYASRAWSSDGHYFTFSIENRLYMADTQAQTVIDTCIDQRNFSGTWSPTSSQFAFLDPYDRNSGLQIFDLTAWQRYIVAYHRGEIIGWRADD